LGVPCVKRWFNQCHAGIDGKDSFQIEGQNLFCLKNNHFRPDGLIKNYAIFCFGQFEIKRF